MPVTRRTALTILGGIAIGYGTVGASGAFDRIELHRDVDVSVGGDASGYLMLAPHPDREDSPYPPEVDYDADGLLYLDFTDADINDEGQTTFSNLIRATNQGSNTISLEARGMNENDEPVEDVIIFGATDNPGILGELAPQEHVDIGMTFETLGNDDVDDLDYIRFTAE